LTFYAGDAPALDSRSLLDIPSDAGDVFDSAFDSAFSTNPTTSLFRIGELSEAANPSPVIDPAGNAIYGPEVSKISAESARERVAGAGLSLKVPDEGISQGALDILIQRQREQLARQQVIARSPSGRLGTQVAAGLAASLLDPLNIASAFVPVVGEARYAALLEGAATPLARFGVRAGVGTVEGAVGAAIIEPLPLLAARQDQTDYSLTDSLANIAMGGVLGGGLHSVGGAVSDALRRRLATDQTNLPGLDTATAVRAPDPIPVTQGRSFDFARVFDQDPETALRQNLSRQIEADQVELRRTAEQQAIDEIRPTLAGERVGNVADLRRESLGLTTRDMGLDATYRDQAKAFQGQGMSRKRAERAARDAIAAERETIRSRQAEINTRLEVNRAGELDRADLGQIERGQIPERLKPQIEARTRQIMNGYQQNPLGAAVRTARDTADLADHKIRESALRTAVAQAVSGREINVKHLFDLEDSAKASNAMDAIRQPQPRRLDADGQAESARADAQPKNMDDVDAAAQALSEDQALVNDLLAQLPEADRTAVLAAGREEADAAEAQAAKAEQYSKAYKAAAICDIRNGR
jgi:hypothetical protein